MRCRHTLHCFNAINWAADICLVLLKHFPAVQFFGIWFNLLKNQPVKHQSQVIQM